MGKMKKVRIYESEIKRTIRRKLMENVLMEASEQEMREKIDLADELASSLENVAQAQKDINDEMNEDFEMKDTYSRKNYRQSPREKDIESVFGQYSEEIPPSVLRYMRKNPEKIVKRLYDIYGQQMFDYISPNLKDNPQYEVSIEDIVRENLRK
tara:strand:+ start:109 stop:570 length:462 start_codon:yes stop_codon:yes gene_type:complete